MSSSTGIESNDDAVLVSGPNAPTDTPSISVSPNGSDNGIGIGSEPAEEAQTEAEEQLSAPSQPTAPASNTSVAESPSSSSSSSADTALGSQPIDPLTKSAAEQQQQQQQQLASAALTQQHQQQRAPAVDAAPFADASWAPSSRSTTAAAVSSPTKLAEGKNQSVRDAAAAAAPGSAGPAAGPLSALTSLSVDFGSLFSFGSKLSSAAPAAAGAAPTASASLSTSPAIVVAPSSTAASGHTPPLPTTSTAGTPAWPNTAAGGAPGTQKPAVSSIPAYRLIERRNLFIVLKFTIKRLIESTVGFGKPVDETHEPLQQMCAVLEHILHHGLKVKRSLLGDRRDPFGCIEALEKTFPLSATAINNIRGMSSIKTQTGKVRAWLRQSLMEKRLSEYFRAMIENRPVLWEWYDDYALVCSDEANVICGLLVSINVIDFNIFFRGEELDALPSVIDYGRHMKEASAALLERTHAGSDASGRGRSASRTSISSNRTSTVDLEDDADNGRVRSLSTLSDHPPVVVTGSSEPSSASQSTIARLLDQKNFLEETLRNMELGLSDTSSKLQTAQSERSELAVQLQAAGKANLALKQEMERLQKEFAAASDSHKRQDDHAKADMTLERETYRKTNADLDLMYNAIKKQLEAEIRQRQAVDKELQNEAQRRSDGEQQIVNLLAQLQDSRDTIDALRQQLSDVKGFNLEMLETVKSAKEEVSLRTSELAVMAENAWSKTQTAERLTAQHDALANEHQLLTQECARVSQRLAEVEEHVVAANTDLTIEKQWREAMQTDLEREKSARAKAESTLVKTQSQMAALDVQVAGLLAEKAELMRKLQEQESALIDLGGALSKSAVKIDNLAQIQESIRTKTWDEDSEVKNCRRCNNAFSMARRRVRELGG
ncbi:hypothetical protein, variant [Capsaspora owczarzaki ATCC 30864]|uniref:RUN domain-containing protein n=1 Tax=Capsaspora owczarzaki (strain ATCC 30864) TaxID=595528 RepID=A0A0D2VG73_CAPO3|nr:hypothetical protein, variant [Capsaspora owczarzaki ATCC 30864]